MLPVGFLKDPILLRSLQKKASNPEYASQRKSVERILRENTKSDVKELSDFFRISQMTPQEKLELMINDAYDNKAGLAKILAEVKDHPLVRDVLRHVQTEEKKLDNHSLDSIITALTSCHIENEITRKQFIAIINQNADLKSQVKDRIIANGQAQQIIDSTSLLSNWMKTPRIFGSVMLKSPTGETDSYRELVAEAAKQTPKPSRGP